MDESWVEIKQRARKAATAARKAAHGAAAHDAAERTAEALVTALAPAPGTIASVYWPMRSEFDARPLIERLIAAGCKVGLPVILGPATPLSFRRYEAGAALVDNGFGTEAPGPEAEELSPSLVVAPLLAFDREGYRLGYGGGFYDRTLEALRARHEVTAIGLAFAAQEVDRVPRESTDQRLDLIATEREIMRIAGP